LPIWGGTQVVSDTQELIRFGTFELNLDTEELRKSGTLMKLAPQPFRLLTLLARRSGQVVTREEIQQTLWGGETYVDFEQGMNHCIKQIRNVLSDSADTPLYVETIPRRGYRFLAPVVTKTIPAPAPRVVESHSGIQTQVAIPQPPPPAVSPSPKAVPDPTVELKPKPEAASDVVFPPPAAASFVVATERTTGSGRRALWIVLAAVAVAVIVVVAGVIYWHSRKTAVLSEKDTIVLADFDNTTGEAVFDNALKQALSVELEQSPFINVLSDQRVTEQLQFMGLPADSRLSGDVARQVCQRAGSKAMIVGSISGIGGSYVIGLRALDCTTGDSLGSEEAKAASRSQVLSALGSATKRLRQRLGESLASVQKYNTPVEQATTPSLDALKAYSLGVKMGNAQGYGAAVPYFKSAIDLDPNFAMAYARLGVEYFNLNQPTLAAQYTTKAYQLRDHTSQREKLYIVSHYHDLVTGNVDQTIAAYQLLQQAYPREAASYLNLTSWYNAIGHYEDALAQAKAAVQLDPNNVLSYTNLALSYIYLNRLEDAQLTLQQAQARDLAQPALLADFYEIAFLHGDLTTMLQYVNAASSKAGIEDQMLALQSDSEAYYGRLSKARELTEAARDSATRAGAKEVAALWQLAGALHEAELGDPQAARKQAAEALANGPGKNVQILGALVLARSGDRKGAQALIDQLVREYPADTMVNDYWVPSVRAAMALSDNNPAATIEALKPTAPYETGSPQPGYAFYPVYLRGLAYLQQRQGPQAAAEFQKMLKYPGVILNLTTAALAHLQLARAEALSGDRNAATKSYNDFLLLWKDADDDLAIRKQARAEYEKLR